MIRPDGSGPYATFATIGLWHQGSLNWLFWGLYHATGVVIWASFTRFRRRHGWRPSKNPLARLVGVGMTVAFVSGSYVFLVTNQHGGLMAGFRMLAKLAWVDLP